MKNKLIPALVILFGLLLLSSPALALTIKTNPGTGNNLVIDEKINDNLLIAGNNNKINSQVMGNAVIVGNVIYFNGATTDSAVLAGNTIEFNGHAKNAAMAAGQVSASGSIDQDLFIASGQTNLNNINISGDAFIATGNLMLSANTKIGRNAKISAAKAVITGEIGGNLNLSDSEDIEIGPTAIIKGNLIYHAKKDIKIQEGARILGTIEKKLPTAKKSAAIPSMVKIIINFVAAILIGSLFILVAPKTTNLVAEQISANTWQSILIGIISIIVTPIALIILAVTMIGFPLATVGLFYFIAMIYLAKIFAAVAIGDYFGRIKILAKAKAGTKLLVGLAFYTLVGLIPVIGWFFKFIVLLLGTGAIMIASNLLLKKFKGKI